MGIVIGGVAPIAVAALLVPLRPHLLNANVALLLTLVVAASGALGGRAAGAVAGVSSALSFNFFHTRPYLSLAIDSSDDVETTVLLLLVGLVTGTLAWRLRHTGEELAAGRSELGRLSRLGHLVARGEEPTEVILAAQDELTGLLSLRDCRFEASPANTAALARLERSGVLSGAGNVHRFSRRGFELPAEGVELPVLGRGHQIGRFVLMPERGVGVTLEERIVAVALADQVGASLAARPAAGSDQKESRDA